MKDKIEQMDRRIRILEQEKHIMNDRLMDQASLIISLGKKVMRMDAIIKDKIKEKVCTPL